MKGLRAVQSSHLGAIVFALSGITRHCPALANGYKGGYKSDYECRTSACDRPGQELHALASWWCRVQVKGKREAFSTEVADVKLAKDRAKLLITEALDGRWKKIHDAITPRPGRGATVGEVLDVFEHGHLDVRKATATNYTKRLLIMIQEVLGLGEAAGRKVRLDQINGAFARTFQAHRQGLKRVESKRLTDGNTTANSVLRCAKAVFSRRAVAAYEEAGLVIPASIRQFTDVPFLAEESHRYSDNPLPLKTIRAIDKALPKLKEKDERLWAIHLMVRLLGLRDSEIMAASKHWLVKGEHGQVELRILKRSDEFNPKRSEGSVPVPPELVRYFAKQKGHLIPAKNDTERSNLIYRKHNEWLRKFIPDREKCAHELRKHFGAVWATKTGSLYVAAQMLRVSLSVAEYHYTALLKKPQALTLADYKLA